MPRPAVYESKAAKQRAYRQRLAAGEASQPRPGAPGYVKWRKAIAEATRLLEDTYAELEAWMGERSERWQESDRAGDLEADRDRLYEAIDKLRELELIGR